MLKIFNDNNTVSADEVEAKYPKYRFLLAHIHADGNEVCGLLKAVSDNVKELEKYRDGLTEEELGLSYLGGEQVIQRIGPYLLAEEDDGYESK